MVKLTSNTDYCDSNHSYSNESLQHIGYRFRYFNDSHIHLGDSIGVGRSITIADILEYKYAFSIMHVLVIDDNLERLQEFINKDVYGLHGLNWVNDDNIGSGLTLNDKIIGCKFHGAYSNYSRPSIAVLDLLDKLGLVLLMHTGRYKDGNEASKTSYIHALNIAKEYKNIKVIMAHMGGTDTEICKKAIAASKQYSNIYFDTSGITTPYIIEYAVKQIPSTRIMFGSDIPWCSWRAMYNTVMDARISNHDMDNILQRSFQNLANECRENI